MVELTRLSIDSMSSREHGRGSGRKRAPDSAVLATISSADAIMGGTRVATEERCSWFGSLSRRATLDLYRQRRHPIHGRSEEIGSSGNSAKPAKASWPCKQRDASDPPQNR